jgi:hypothetical protein
MGYLSAKPSVRYLPSGTAVANVRLGESYRYQDPDGKSQRHTNWHSLKKLLWIQKLGLVDLVRFEKDKGIENT